MNVVLCNNETYEKLYQKEAYKYLQLRSIEQLLGFGGIIVLVHEDDLYEEDHYYNLQHQVEALGLFGYVRVHFVEEDGYSYPQEQPESVEIITGQKKLI